MNLFRKRPRGMTLKNQLIISFLLVALVPTLTFSVYLTLNSVEILGSSYVDNRGRAVSQTNDNLERQTQWIRSVSDQFFLSAGVSELLKRSPEEANRFDKEYSEVMISMGNQYQFTPVASYVRALIILGNNGAQLRLGSDASMVPMEELTASQWYLESEETDGVYWGEPIENFSPYSNVETVIPARVRLADTETGKNLGSIILLLDPEFFSSCYENLIGQSGSAFYVVKPNGEILSSTGGEFSFEFVDSVLSELLEKKAYEIPVTHFETSYEGTPVLVTYQRSGDTGWTVAEFLPMEEIQGQIMAFLTSVLILVLVAAVLCGVLSYFLSRSLTRPIENMVRRVKQIGQGRFEAKMASSQEMPRNEIGILNESIEQMQKDIDGLIRENVSKEREKRTFEMQMLQSQINPHFLYNALNTIKLMAAFQGAAGIEKMLVALGRILRYSLGETREKVTLSDELGVLEDYIHIQKIRYKGKISFRREVGEELLSALVPRFILQPIVENCVKHGFANFDDQGEIVLKAAAEDGSLLISIEDNGVGMTVEQLEEMREKLNSPLRKTGGANGLGVLNVHSRIRLLYGDSYGVRVESGNSTADGTGNFGTRVTIILKLEYGGAADENSDS